ncbi:hypothetical protein D3C71_1331800 [compost metagenome]
MTLKIGDRRLYILGEALGKVGTLGMIKARRRHYANVRTKIDRNTERWRKFRHRIGEAVISGFSHDYARASCTNLSNTISKIVCLASRTGQHEVRKLGLRHCRDQTFGQFQNGVVQVPGIGGEGTHLLAYRFGHGRMTMPK